MAKLCRRGTTLVPGNSDNGLTKIGRFEHDLLKVEQRNTTLIEVGEAWRCRRLPHETDRAFAFRLGVHLQTLSIGIEEDLACVLKAERSYREEQ